MSSNDIVIQFLPEKVKENLYVIDLMLKRCYPIHVICTIRFYLYIK